MSEEIQNFTPEQNLAFIRGIMDEAKRKTANYGPWLLLWGSLSSAATVGQYLGVRQVIDMALTPFFWVAMGVIGVIGTRILAKNAHKTCATNSELFRVNAKLWQGAGLSVFIYLMAKLAALSLGMGSPIDHEFLAYIAGLMGMSFYATSYNSGLKGLKFVAFGWWAAVLLFVINPFPEEDLLLIIAVLDFILIAVPGYGLMQLHKTLLQSSEN